MVDLAADGGLDAVGNWHDTDGRFQKRGVSTAKALAVKAVRGLAAAAHVKDKPDGDDLDLNDTAPAALAERLGGRARVTWHDEKHGAVKVDGRRVLVPWTAFDDPPDAPVVNEVAERPFASVAPDGKLHRAVTEDRTYDPTGPQGAVYFTGHREYASNYGDKVTTIDVPDRSRVLDIRDPADRARVRDEAKAVLAEAEAKLPDVGEVHRGAKPFVTDAHRYLNGDDDSPSALAVGLANVSTVLNYAENPTSPYRAGTAHRRILDRLGMDAMTDVESHGLDDIEKPGAISFAFRHPPDALTVTSPAENELVEAPERPETVDRLMRGEYPIVPPAPVVRRVANEPVVNELAVATDDRVANYVTPAVERWAEKRAAAMDGKPGALVERSLSRWREDPSEARARDLFRVLTEGSASRGWIEETLASPTPDPDAVSTLRMMHSATVYEMGNQPHTFARENDTPGDPFAPGAAGRQISKIVGAGPQNTTSWVRTDIDSFSPSYGGFGSVLHEQTFGPDQILGNAGAMAAAGEYLIVEDPEAIPRLMRGEYPAVSEPVAAVNDLVEAPVRPRGAPDVDPGELPPPVVSEGLHDAERAAQRAVERLNEIHHEDVGINGVTLATLPTIAGNDLWRDRPLDPATQRYALDRLFHPDNTDGLITSLPIIDETAANRGTPLGAVAVNVETGAIVGTHAPWSADTAPPYGQWASLPADHPQAAALVTSAWLASPEVKRYIDTNLMPRLRQGYTTDPAFPGLTETIRRNSDSIAAPYRGHPDIAVSRVTGPDGTYYVPDPDGRQSIDGDEIRFADFSEDGGTRLWVSKIGVNEPDATARLGDLDYSTADDDDLPWAERVAALAKVRAEITEIFGPDPSAMFSRPTEEDMRDLLVGSGGEREFAHIEALERFGESLEALVIQRERDAVAPEPSIDKASVLAKLREIPGVPPALADLLEREPWDGQVVGAVLNPRPGAPNGGGRVDITFPDHPESRVMVFTSVRGTPPQTYVGWEFSASHQRDLGADEFVALPPSKMLTVSPGYAPFEWFDDLNESNPAAPRERGSTPTMAAWIDTMEALGVDMGNDPDVYFALGRDRDGEIGGQPERGANPVRYGDLSEEGILQHSAEVGMRAYPKAWTQRLGGRLIRIAVDDDRTRPVGASSSWPDVGVVDVANVDKHGEFADTLTHEFAHQFEQSIPGLMLLETWHFIKRLRAEAKRTQKLATWEWDDQRFGFVDEFGDQYMGRVYRNPHTGVTGVTSMGGSEIFSTASQTLWANEERNAADLDPQARRLFMGVMATIEPPGLDPDERWRP